MNTIEEKVDAARDAATRVREARKKAEALKDATMQITERDAWELHKKAKSFCEEAEQVMLEAETAYGKASDCWHAVADATRAYVQINEPAALAGRTARCAYDQANKDVNIVSGLVSEVKQNCKELVSIFADNVAAGERQPAVRAIRAAGAGPNRAAGRRGVEPSHA